MPIRSCCRLNTVSAQSLGPAQTKPHFGSTERSRHLYVRTYKDGRQQSTTTMVGDRSHQIRSHHGPLPDRNHLASSCTIVSSRGCLPWHDDQWPAIPARSILTRREFNEFALECLARVLQLKNRLVRAPSKRTKSIIWPSLSCPQTQAVARCWYDWDRFSFVSTGRDLPNKISKLTNTGYMVSSPRRPVFLLFDCPGVQSCAMTRDEETSCSVSTW